MKIDIAKEDLWWLRETLRVAIWRMENCPNPPAWSKMPAVARKVYKKLAQAQTKAHGHDYGADKSYFPND